MVAEFGAQQTSVIGYIALNAVKRVANRNLFELNWLTVYISPIFDVSPKASPN